MKTAINKSLISLAAAALCCLSTGFSDFLTITNHSFETDDVVVDGDFDASTISGPAGWDVYNTFGTDGGFRQFGTLNPSTAQFDSVPDGVNVGLVFLRTENVGEAGLQQTLSDTLQLNTTYTLTVEVGNFRDDGPGGFDFDGFPGYRIDLMAGTAVLNSDNDSLSIAEGIFAPSTVMFTTGASHDNAGEALRIRLVNLNGPGIEVNFDNVRLDAVVVPEPSIITLLMAGALAAYIVLRRRK